MGKLWGRGGGGHPAAHGILRLVLNLDGEVREWGKGKGWRLVGIQGHPTVHDVFRLMRVDHPVAQCIRACAVSRSGIEGGI